MKRSRTKNPSVYVVRIPATLRDRIARRRRTDKDMVDADLSMAQATTLLLTEAIESREGAKSGGRV